MAVSFLHKIKGNLKTGKKERKKTGFVLKITTSFP
jgi:hypothetical protein